MPPSGSRRVRFLTVSRLALRLEPVRPCFMPIAPMGLRPSELFPLEEPVTFRCLLPSCSFFHNQYPATACYHDTPSRNPPAGARRVRLPKEPRPGTRAASWDWPTAPGDCDHRARTPTNGGDSGRLRTTDPPWQATEDPRLPPEDREARRDKIHQMRGAAPESAAVHGGE